MREGGGPLSSGLPRKRCICCCFCRQERPCAVAGEFGEATHCSSSVAIMHGVKH